MEFTLTADDIRRRNEDVFVFDLEWIGNVSDDPSKCKIWEIGCIHQKSGETFRISIMPDLPGDNFSLDHNGSDAVPPVTRQSIAQDEHYATLRSGIRVWEAWIRVITEHPILISHNCFSADLPVLRAECIRAAIALENWCFMDSLSFCRYALRGTAASFGVYDICNALGINPEPHPHRALEDAKMLSNILRHIDEVLDQTISGTATDLLSIPLQAISGIGHHTAAELRLNPGVHSIYDLYSAILQQGNPFDEVHIGKFIESHVPQSCSDARCAHIAQSAVKWAAKLGI